MTGTEAGTPQSGAAGREVLRAQGVFKTYGRNHLFRDLTLSLRAGEATAIVGRPGCGKSMLVRLLSGQILPDAGSIVRTTAPAPPLGRPTGFGTTARIGRDLALRASAFGLDQRDYVAAVEDLLPDPRVLDMSFKRADGRAMAVLAFSSCYLVPSDVYICDNLPFPNQPDQRREVEPLFQEARKRAAVVWCSSAVAMLREIEPDNILLLEHGRLQHLASVDEAEKILQPRKYRMRMRAQDEANRTKTLEAAKKPDKGKPRPDAGSAAS